MDPHSTHSQYNARPPKAGPAAAAPARAGGRKGKEKEGAGRDREKGKEREGTVAPSGAMRRPIASNARVMEAQQMQRTDMHRAFVGNALAQKTLGTREPFDALVAQFSAKPPQPAQLRLWLGALGAAVSRLERTHAAVVQAAVGLPWAAMDGATAKAYTAFAGALLSAKPEYLSLVLGKIVNGFTYHAGALAADPETPLTRRVIYERQHALLEHLLTLVPTAPGTLGPLLARAFPHKREPPAAHTAFVRNALRVARYCPELEDRILATVVDRALQIDVEIQVELEELEAAQDEGGVFEIEIDPFDVLVGQEEEEDSGSDDEGGLEEIESDDEGAARKDPVTDVRHVQAMVRKLDAVLDLVFEHLSRRAGDTPDAASGDRPALPELPPLPPLSPARASSPFLLTPPSPPPPSTSTPITPPPPPRSLHTQFHTLLALFDRLILPTFRSRHTQFLLFYHAALAPDFTDVFLGLLVERALLQPGAAAVTRAAAAAYLGSFVSRARSVGRAGVRDVVGVLCEYVRAQVEQGVGDAVFYAAAQALLLIFCFRWRDLRAEPDPSADPETGAGAGGGAWLPALGAVPRMVASPLNPLRVCAPGVVRQFARVARATGFVYVYTILDANRRAGAGPSGAGAGRAQGPGPGEGGGGGGEELHAFFPFDPCRLPRAGRWVAGMYREWGEVAVELGGAESDDDDEEDEGGSDGEGSDGAGEGGLPMSVDDAGLGASLGAMSISPARAPVAVAAWRR
ncbi:RNA polymerase I-specific transcription initiation factor RRN3 [Mycena indigotica]|uniref:RNA polymerase I-specific transcription initiation factor RRN3 n=1 Tax=Mycena indigotica TaxID=2126181 RepID=A0A8H6W1Y0_9AGAR|nr:RNA polymerase I-specific transcription initiation factor RRN3 [Mycena indigotica]KAF7302012.1 RNA polymerase I-specific transcription initiation factor RRN3 [Mycena indigotica]